MGVASRTGRRSRGGRHMTYVNGADLAEAKDLRRQGYSIRMLAARMGIAPELLAKLLGETLHKCASNELL